MRFSFQRIAQSCWALFFAFILLTDGFFFAHSSHESQRLLQYSSVLSPSRLSGGYFDETKTNVDPKLGIQFYTLKGGMCPYAARTLITLLELKFDFQAIEIQGKPDWYLNINPRGKVPALQIPSDRNAVLYESAICNEYLCDHHNQQQQTNSNHSLMPQDPLLRARIRLLNDHYDTVVGPAQFTFLMNKDIDKDESLKIALEDSLDVYEKTLSTTGGPFLMGESFTLADVHFLPFFYRLVISLSHYKDYRLDRQRFARLVAWYDTCAQRDSVRSATPSEERVVEVYKMFVEKDYAFGGLNKNV